MPDLLVLAAVAALVAGVVTSVLVPPLARLAAALPLPRRSSSAERGRSTALAPGALDAGAAAIPRLGGVAMFVGIGLACGAGLVARWPIWSQVIPRNELLALGFGAALVFLVGVVDDLVGVSPARKFLVQLLAAWLVVRVGWTFHVLRLPLVGEVDLGIWGGVVSLLWVVGVTNAINLLDGLDGLAGGVAAIIAGSLAAISVYQDNQGTAILLAAVVGACLGFLWHNWEPARIFMGDGGSLTLGFLFGALTLHSSIKAPATVAILVPILALGLPVLDTLLVMTLRFAEGEGRSIARRFLRMFHADRSHVHHLLGTLVVRRRRIVALLYATALLFCAGAVAVAVSGAGGIGLVLLAIEFVVVLSMRRLGLAAEARALAREQRAATERWLASYRDDATADDLERLSGAPRES